jgi:hypothetical protein
VETTVRQPRHGATVRVTCAAMTFVLNDQTSTRNLERRPPGLKKTE